jgi:hypothetical protein
VKKTGVFTNEKEIKRKSRPAIKMAWPGIMEGLLMFTNHFNASILFDRVIDLQVRLQAV